MSGIVTIEIHGEIIGLLTKEPGTRKMRFHSGIAPFDLLDGSYFVQAADAERAAHRVADATRSKRTGRELLRC